MTDTADLKRVLLEIEHAIRELNKDIINPEIPELTVDSLCQLPDDDIEQLQALRHTYEELVAGAQALQTAIERGYLDVKRKG